MDDNTKMLLKFFAVGAGGILLYVYLKNNGMLPAILGGTASNSFTNPAQLMAYCQANPTGTAIYVDAQGIQHTAPCSQWLSANSSVSSAPSPSGGSAPTTSLPVATQGAAINSTVLAQLRAAAIANVALGSDRANVDQWNYFLAQIEPGAVTTDLSSVGIQRGVNDTMDASTYLATRARAGLAGMSQPQESDPYAWVN